MEEKKTIYFPNLDVVRCLCALMIIALHSYGSWQCWMGYHQALVDSNKQLTVVGKFCDTFFNNMGLGVDVFFLISGFLITYILLTEKSITGKIDIKKFFLRRGLRIWPLYFFILILGPSLFILKKAVAPAWLHQDLPMPHYLQFYFFLGNFEIIKSGAFNFPFSHLWSICVEEHFYLVWPFVIAFIPQKHLRSVFLLLVLVSIFFRAYHYQFDIKSCWLYDSIHTLSNIDTLVIGSFCGLLYFETPRIFKTPTWIRIAVLLLFIFILGLESSKLYNSVLMEMFKKYFYLGIIIFLVANFMFNEKTILTQKKTLLHYLGKTSYGIYMYQNIVIAILGDFLLLRVKITNPWAYYGIVVTSILLISTFSWEVFEKQILKVKKRFENIRTSR